MRTGVARKKIDMAEYRDQLEERLGHARAFMRGLSEGAVKG